MDWALPVLRWALFVDLGIVFGVPVAAVVTGSRTAISQWRPVLTVAALVGIVLSATGFLLAMANMAGTAPSELDRTLILSMLSGTALGTALSVRTVGLVVYAGLGLLRGSLRTIPLILSGGIAVATLAWSGHAAASQGMAAWLRLAGDVFHLLAGLSWVGALVLFAAMVWQSAIHNAAQWAYTVKALSAFAFAGSVIVAVLAVSGFANLLFLLPLAELPTLLDSQYGELLLFKLAVFCGMLGLAGLNRFALVPGMEHAQRAASEHTAIFRLKLSVSLELLAALAVLALVAWAGTLDPLGIGN